MKKYLACFIGALLLNTTGAYATERYVLDKSHTSILFYINHLGFSDMVGQFRDYDGSFLFSEQKPEESSVDVVIRTKGILTSSSELDKELQGSKWFNAEQFPQIHFVSTGVTVSGGNAADVTGTLTLLGVSKPVTLHVHFNKAGYHPLTNDYVAGFQADCTIKRSDFGMDHLVPWVGNEVRLTIFAEGIDQEKKAMPLLKH